MSWLFSQALVEEYLGANCLDGEPCVPSSGNPTQQAYLPPDKMTDFSRVSRSGMTFKPLTVDRGEELLMSYLAGFRAKTSQLPEKEMDLMDNAAGCGNTWRGWLAKYDPDTSSWRTAQCSLLAEEPELLQTLPRSGMTRDGLLWEQPMLERHINATDSGLWPTPLVRGFTDDGAIQALSKMCSSYEELSAMAYRAAEKKKKKYWPTPTVNDSKNSTLPPSQIKHDNIPGALLRSGQKPGGALNPTWVEWLMGWPLGWTDLKPLATDKSHCVPQKHGDTLMET